MCISIISMGNTSEALLACGVPDLKLHFDAVDGHYLILWTDGVSCILVSYSNKKNKQIQRITFLRKCNKILLLLW